MRTLLTARKADDVAFLQYLLTFGRAQRRLAAEHEHPLLVQVMRVVGPEPAARLDLGHGRADQLTADALADERALDAPTLAVSRPVPLVAVEVESLHSANRTSSQGTSPRTPAAWRFMAGISQALSPARVRGWSTGNERRPQSRSLAAHCGVARLIGEV
jgi:hypothetical protein